MLKSYPNLFFKAGLISLLVIISYLAFTPTLPDDSLNTGFDKLNHFLAFFLLAIFFDLSFPDKAHMSFIFLPLFIYAVLIECVQYFLPFRSFSLLDITADLAAVLFYLWSSRYLLKNLVLRL
ncbi:MAG: VanZ family protein [Pseudomonadota bacterium]